MFSKQPHFVIFTNISKEIHPNVNFIFITSFRYSKYAAIVFLASMRFETSKRKLQYLNFSDFLECAQAIMTFWTYTYQHTGPEYYDTEMDKEFLLDLRELRCLLDKEKEIKQYEFICILFLIFKPFVS